MSADAPGFVRRTVASVRFRLFVTAWLLFALHFATNIQREHYPAMALAEDGTFRCDAFEPGFHSDIFRYRDGHAYIGNNLGTSVLVAPLLVLFDPVLDALETREKRALGREPAESRPAYDTTYRNRAELFRLVRERGWTLRFGAVAAITATLFVAPLSALCLVLLFDQLRRRAVSERRALVLAILFGFATPILFRSANLTNNMPVMYAVFGAFLALFGGDGAGSASTRRHTLAGFLCGLALFCDYAAVVACLVFGAAVVWRNLFAFDRPSRDEGIRRILVFGLAAAPPIVALLWTQKLCFGGWFVIGQMAMPAVNYTDHGWRGFALPDPVTFGANNVDPRFGLFSWAPILALGLLPPRRRDVDAPLPRRPWLVAAAFIGAFLLFCAGNRYSRMQFNTGVRYLMPVVPFLFLSACNRLARLDGRVLALIAVPSVVHAWVLTMARDFSGHEYHAGHAWLWFLENGPRLPWLHVLQSTSAGAGVPRGAGPHLVLILGALLFIVLLWRLGAAYARRRPAP